MPARNKALVVKKDSLVSSMKQEIHPIVVMAKELEIKDPKGMERGTEILSQLNQYLDKVTIEKEKVTKPANDILKAERARWKPVETIGEEAIAVIREKMSAYQTAEIKRQKEEEKAIAGRVGDGKGKLQVETAVRKIEEIERVDNKVISDSGSVKFREDKVLKIVDETLIPREYLILNEKKILEDLKAGKKVLGAEIDIKMVPLNYR